MQNGAQIIEWNLCNKGLRNSRRKFNELSDSLKLRGQTWFFQVLWERMSGWLRRCQKNNGWIMRKVKCWGKKQEKKLSTGTELLCPSYAQMSIRLD